MSTAIDGTFKNSLAETLTETEKAFQMGFVSMTEAIVVAIQLVSFVIIVIIMAVVANTMAMTTRERIGEYAVFKTLGFGGWFIAGLIFGESLVISLTGTAIGIGLTFPGGGLWPIIWGPSSRSSSWNGRRSTWTSPRRLSWGSWRRSSPPGAP